MNKTNSLREAQDEAETAALELENGLAALEDTIHRDTIETFGEPIEFHQHDMVGTILSPEAARFEAVAAAAEAVRESVEPAPEPESQTDLVSTLATSTRAMALLLERTSALHDRLVGTVLVETTWPVPADEETAKYPIFTRVRHEAWQIAKTALTISAVLDEIEKGLNAPGAS